VIEEARAPFCNVGRTAEHDRRISFLRSEPAQGPSSRLFFFFFFFFFGEDCPSPYRFDPPGYMAPRSRHSGCRLRSTFSTALFFFFFFSCRESHGKCRLLRVRHGRARQATTRLCLAPRVRSPGVRPMVASSFFFWLYRTCETFLPRSLEV